MFSQEEVEVCYAADLLSSAILYLNAEDVGLLSRLKFKKKNKIKNNKKQTENNYKKNAKLAFEQRSLECKARILTTVVRYHRSS